MPVIKLSSGPKFLVLKYLIHNHKCLGWFSKARWREGALLTITGFSVATPPPRVKQPDDSALHGHEDQGCETLDAPKYLLSDFW